MVFSHYRDMILVNNKMEVKKMKPIVVIPAYNPDDKLIHLIKDLTKLGLQCVVVNDGSNQDCSYVFDTISKMYLCDVYSYRENKGKGAALKIGLKYASEKYLSSCGFVTADADGQHAPKDILKVAETLEYYPEQLILGVRNFNNLKVPFKSKWGNRITSFVFLISSGRQCADTQTGLRGIPRDLLETCIRVPGNRYEYEMNFLMEATKAGRTFLSVPIESIYIDENKSSHFHPIKDSIRIYYNILKYSLSSLTSSLVDLTIFTLMVHFLIGKSAIGIFVSTVTARIISGSVNFLLNKHVVFESKEKNITELIKYFTLFCCQMLTSWLFVSIISKLSIPITLVKIGVDSALFIISYQIQKRFIFVSKNEGRIS